MTDTQDGLMMAYIYKITNTQNKMVYVGSTRNLEGRLQQHSYCATRMGKHPLYVDIRKLGISAFTLRLVETVPYNKVGSAKAKWMAAEKAAGKGIYNAKRGPPPSDVTLAPKFRVTRSKAADDPSRKKTSICISLTPIELRDFRLWAAEEKMTPTSLARACVIALLEQANK